MGGESELVKARIALITEIQRCGDELRASAESAAMTAARKPGDKDAASYARERVLVHDARKAMADEIVKLVWKHWPKDPE